MSELKQLIDGVKKRLSYCEKKHEEAVRNGNPDRGFRMMTLYMEHFDLLNKLENHLSYVERV